MKIVEKKYYETIDVLRAMACIGIVMMHIAANNHYNINGFVYQKMIPSFTNFVFLFMTISAFGMCCGYYDKVLQNKISVVDFYKKRYSKILPFFAVLVLLDVVTSPSMSTLYEAFADFTLLFGFLPGAGNISVIGVGWFLGIIFVFYLCFPFFCYLLENKKRAWIAFGISLIYNFVCAQYFKVGRSNILYSACFFLVGGLIYLYRDKLEKANWTLGLLVSIVSVVFYYAFGGNIIMCLLISAAFISFAVILEEYRASKFIKFISGISMEIYLSHMVIFRAIEKIGLNRKFGTGWMQYVLTVVLVLAGTICFSIIVKKAIEIIQFKNIQGVRSKR